MLSTESKNMASVQPGLDQRLWDRHWHLLCHRSELPAANDFIRLEVCGEDVVVFNDGASIVVFNNRCPHRGTKIYDGRDGHQRWVCPYHGWSYAKGRLFISRAADFETCDVSTARLHTYDAEWVGDFLFASKAPAQPLRTQLEGVVDVVEGISRSIETRLDFNSYTYDCNWKIAVENALDQYHVALVHRDSLNKMKLEPAQDEYLGDNNISRAALGDERVVRQLSKLRRFFDFDYQPEGYIAVYLFPFTFITSTLGYSYSLQQFYPTANEDKAAFNSRFYASRLAGAVSPGAMKTFFDSSIAVNHQVFDEDGAVCSRIPTDSWSPEPPPYVSRGEEKILYFRRSMAAHVEG